MRPPYPPATPDATKGRQRRARSRETRLSGRCGLTDRRRAHHGRGVHLALRSRTGRERGATSARGAPRRSQADARFCMSSRSARRPAMVAGGRSRDVGAPARRLDRQRQHTEIRATHKAPALGERARPPRTRRSPTTTASGARCLGRRRSSATPPIVPDRRNAFRRRCDRGGRGIRAPKAPARAVSLGARDHAKRAARRPVGSPSSATARRTKRARAG
jgi:hypothetical protein